MPRTNPNGNVLFYERVLAVAGLGLLAVLLYRILEPFFAPLAWAVFLGFLLQPAQARLSRWLRGRESIAAFLLTVLVLLLFIGPLTALAVAFARQAAELAGLLQQWIVRQEGRSFADLAGLPVIAQHGREDDRARGHGHQPKERLRPQAKRRTGSFLLCGHQA